VNLRAIISRLGLGRHRVSTSRDTAEETKVPLFGTRFGTRGDCDWPDMPDCWHKWFARYPVRLGKLEFRHSGKDDSYREWYVVTGDWVVGQWVYRRMHPAIDRPEYLLKPDYRS